MYNKFKDCLNYIAITAITLLFLWNLYTISFHGYITNWFWETYYEEEPRVFIRDLIELFIEGFLPIIFLFSLSFIDYITDKLRKTSPVCAVKKAKRLRRKKRKKKRKQ